MSNTKHSAAVPAGFHRFLLTAGCLALLVFAAHQPASARVGGAESFTAVPEQAVANSLTAGAVPNQSGFDLVQMEGRGDKVFWSGLGALGVLALLAWTLQRGRGVNSIAKPGFEVITTSEVRQFIPLEEKFQQMDYLAKVETRGALRLSANLNKVNLSFRRYGYLLEDKNFRNALLVNRRRVRRTLLRDGDVLDLGDLTLLYRDNREVPITRHSAVTPPEGKVQIKFDRVRGPVRKGTPMLVSDQAANRGFYITKNLVFLGRSENNDLIIKSQGVSYRHAKIERVGGRYKLLDLSGSGNTYVNNRRVEQRMLRDGDEIAVDNQRFKFQLVNKFIKEPAPARQSARGNHEERTEGNSQDEEMQAGPEDKRAGRHEGPEANA